LRNYRFLEEAQILATALSSQKGSSFKKNEEALLRFFPFEEVQKAKRLFQKNRRFFDNLSKTGSSRKKRFLMGSSKTEGYQKKT